MSNQNATILPEQLVNAARVIAFAKANGFPGANILYWDRENPEYGMESIEELMEDGGTVHVTLGITLNAPAMECRREWDEEGDELGPVIYGQNDQSHRSCDDKPNPIES